MDFAKAFPLSVSSTLTTLEVAEMMEVPHSDLLKKLEGWKDRKGYMQILGEGQMSASDYFVLGWKEPVQ